MFARRNCYGISFLFSDPAVSDGRVNFTGHYAALTREVQRTENHRIDAVAILCVASFGCSQAELFVEGVNCVARLRLTLFLHPLDQQFEHFHRETVLTFPAQTQAQRL